MDLTHWPTTSLGRCNRHEQSSWIPEYSIYPGPSLPPPCHSLNAEKHWGKKIGYRKYARALSESCKPCSGPPFFLPSVDLITRNCEQNCLNQECPTMATSAESHSGGKATGLTGVFSHHTSLPHCHKTEPGNTHWKISHRWCVEFWFVFCFFLCYSTKSKKATITVAEMHLQPLLWGSLQ